VSIGTLRKAIDELVAENILSGTRAGALSWRFTTAANEYFRAVS